MKKKNSSSAIPVWEQRLARVLEIGILISGFFQLFFGETAIGLLILLSLGAIIFPEVWSRKSIKVIPIEVKILLFFMVILQLILGEARDFYNNVPYYDKIVHFFLPLFLGFITFLIFYSMYVTGNFKTNLKFMVILIVLTALGIGALWEIFEYSSDVLLYPNIPGWHHFQGNAQQDALTDTMTDLIDDTIGGLFGALLGIWFIGRLENKNVARFNQLLQEIKPKFALGPAPKRAIKT
jgi:hypothetical protein